MQRGDNHKNRVGSFKNILKKTNGLKKLKCTRKLFDIVQKEVYQNHSPWGLDEATIGETFFLTCVFLGKLFQ
jgi:hypothetical protein